jgi:hypothetical protein
MGRTACTEPQCLYSRAIPLLPLWAVRPVPILSANTKVQFTFFFDMYMSYRPVIWYDCSPHIHRTEFVTSHNEKKTKAIKCGAFNYSIELNAHRLTNMADINTDAVRKQKKAEYNKQYRLKCKLLLQQQASKYIYMIRYFHP